MKRNIYKYTYLYNIYGMFYRFGLIDVPKEVKEKKNDRGNKKQKKGREDMLEENIKFFRRL